LSLSERRDPLGAFCAHASIVRPGRPFGALAGLRFAVKDVFEIAGETACFGNPTWLATHAPAEASAPVLGCLQAAGATLVGTTMTDELAFSLTGENAHYGTPVNSACPDRIPGGSSSGSAAAVAGGLVDFALGTDTGGSVRVPASHCGVLGIRPTHGAVSTIGVLPFAPRFDTVGWFARDAETLAAVGDVLLPPAPAWLVPRRALLLEDALGLLAPGTRAEFRACAQETALRLGLSLDTDTAAGEAGPLTGWLLLYLTLQNAEFERAHREWIERARPRFGPLIAGRVLRALAMSPQEVRAAEEQLVRVRDRVLGLVEGGALLILPSACGPPPCRGASDDELNADTGRSLTLSSIASLGGLPQLSLPLARAQGLPLGLSLVAAPGRDRALLALARRLISPEPPGSPAFRTS
jgi:amidase